ncbi:tRNA(fMet)-specific endonuclease VapC [Sphingopyxis panaciterrulae]|uniref:tRNA(fMet)-specific endonuclease VapC n=2 Tax=Sphingopyxis panaciterrulae TaxID=462372 RepID=A0A7W9B2X2_9SPHN|nr:tRNA(fMet)-specific endonuclease VapC [Sphingopyxis panaciterrulae]
MTARYEPLRTRLTACAPGDVAISAISFAEIALGSEQGRPPLPEVLEAFLAAIPLVPFDESAARAYSKLPFRRARFDRLLAAHALSLDVVVITNNEGDFADVPGLRIENWTR